MKNGEMPPGTGGAEAAPGGSEVLRILLIEDDEVDRMAIRRILTRYQDTVRVREVEGVSEARAALAADSFDCALLDRRLPDGEGMELIRDIEATSKQKTAVVMLTGIEDEAAALHALSEGADDYLVKGNMDDFAILRAVRYAMQRRRVDDLRAQIRHMDRLAGLGRLAAGAAHEINNPLTCIIANLSWLNNQPEFLNAAAETEAAGRLSKTDLRAMIADCLTAAEQVAGVVRDLGTLSRGEDRELTPLSLERVVSSAINVTGIQLRERARLVKAFSQTPPVLGSAQRLIQVFVNLLTNAAQAIPAGRPADNEVRVATKTSESGGAVVEISDTGRGISPADRKHVFEPFFTTKRQGEGTGLGLSICWGIVRSLRGEIECEPRSGRGTTFRVTLPAARASARGRQPWSNRPGLRAP